MKGWGENGFERAKACLAQLPDCYKEVIAEASRIPVAERLAPRQKKEGAFDLTSSKVFLTSHPNMQKVVAAVRQVNCWGPDWWRATGCCGAAHLRTRLFFQILKL